MNNYPVLIWFGNDAKLLCSGVIYKQDGITPLVPAPLGFTPENVANKDTDNTLSANSDTKYASQKATKTYADTKQAALGFTPENVANKDTDGTLSANSDTKYASQKATKTYVDASFTYSQILLTQVFS